MVDAGFLRPSIKKALKVDVEPFGIDVGDLATWYNLAARRYGDGLLRLYWYDAIWPAQDHRHAEQRRGFDEIETEAAVRVRLGTLRSRPSPWRAKLAATLKDIGADVADFNRRFNYVDPPVQKGVDSLLVLDMVRLAQTNAYDSLILIASDADLSEAVKVVQDMGKDVIVAFPVGARISPDLYKLADELVEIGEVQLRRMLKSKPGLPSATGQGRNEPEEVADSPSQTTPKEEETDSAVD